MVTAAPEFVVGEERDVPNGARLRVREDGTYECARCNAVKKDGAGFPKEQGVVMHWNRWCEQNPKQLMAETNQKVAQRAALNDKQGIVIRSNRGRQRLDIARAPTAIEEVAERPGGMRGGPAAYFIRRGATISEALIVSPNGAPMMRAGRDRANSAMYQQRMKDKGFEYIGPTLTAQGIKRLADVIARDRQDYILFLSEEIDLTEQTIRETENPDLRDHERQRRNQLSLQLEIASRPFDVDAMIAEMDDILKAMKLAALTPAMREAMSAFVDQAVSARVEALVSKLEHKKAGGGEDGVSVQITNAAEDDEF